MTTSRALGVLVALGLVTASAPDAADAGPRREQLRKDAKAIKAGAKNIRPSIGRRVEKLKIGARAWWGKYRERELVPGKQRTFHNADGSNRVEQTSFEIVKSRALVEKIDSQAVDATGQRGRLTTQRPGNRRRELYAFFLDFQIELLDPDLRAAAAGDRAAKDRWVTRLKAHEAKGTPTAPHNFVDRDGNTIQVEGSVDVLPNPVPLPDR